jgi:hypothetical protein
MNAIADSAGTTNDLVEFRFIAVSFFLSITFLDARSACRDRINPLSALLYEDLHSV